jgi:hypothetical protein
MSDRESEHVEGENLGYERVDELLRRWRHDEERLYATVFSAPQRYSTYVELARAVADQLTSCQTVEELVAAYDDVTDIVGAAADHLGIPAAILDGHALIGGAGFRLRYQEVADHARRAAALDRVRNARQAGQAWAVLYESGDCEHPQHRPYHRLETHLPSGAGVYSFAEPDPETFEASYGTERVRVDLASATAYPESSTRSERRITRTKPHWHAATTTLRERIEAENQ